MYILSDCGRHLASNFLEKLLAKFALDDLNYNLSDFYFYKNKLT